MEGNVTLCRECRLLCFSKLRKFPCLKQIAALDQLFVKHPEQQTHATLIVLLSSFYEAALLLGVDKCLFFHLRQAKASHPLTATERLYPEAAHAAWKPKRHKVLLALIRETLCGS